MRRRGPSRVDSRAVRRWWILLACLLLLTGLRSSARASESPVTAWGLGCPKERGLTVVGAFAAEGMVSFDVQPGDLRLEVRLASGRSFRRAGRYGVSPVGQFADWSAEPEVRRRALDAVVGCLIADPTLPLTGAGSSAPHADANLAPETPWLALLGLALLVGLALALARPRERWRGALLVVALGSLSFVARAYLAPWAYFHQNGQGPLWVGYALGEPSPYGLGYHQVFSRAAAWLPGAPEFAVFRSQALLGALVAPVGWLLARRAGARPALALAAALLIALDPTLARGAQSESYYAICTSLLFAATAAIALGSRPRARWSFAFAVFTAGIFVATVARVHPVAWVPAALVALVPLSLPGRPRDRLRRAALAALGIGAAAALLSGRAMLAVLEGALGQQWMPTAHASTSSLGSLTEPACLVLVALGLCAIVAPLRALLLPVSALGVTLLAMRGVSLVEGQSAYILGAYRLLYLPSAALAVAAILGHLARSRRAAILAASVLVCAGVGLAASRWPAQAYVSTDAREQAWTMTWRDRLPADACVAYIDRAEPRVLVLPLYGRCSKEWTWTAGGAPRPDLGWGGPLYYVHTSLCSTPQAEDACRRFESAHRLHQIERVTIPSLPSLPYAPLPPGSIDAVLYRVTGPR